MGIFDYVELLKIRNHLFFLTVALGAVLFSGTISISMLKSLALLYFSFTFLFYSGLYIINDVADMKSDSMHHEKKKRPLPSGRVNPRLAIVLAAIFISAGLSIGYSFFQSKVFYIFIAVAATSLTYTFIAKKIPYIELIFGSATHALRLLMGAFLAGSSAHYPIIFAFYLLVLAVLAAFREMEKSISAKGRTTLKYYSREKIIVIELLALFLIMLISLFDMQNFIFYSAIAAAGMAIICSINFKKTRSYISSVWYK